MSMDEGKLAGQVAQQVTAQMQALFTKFGEEVKGQIGGLHGEVGGLHKKFDTLATQLADNSKQIQLMDEQLSSTNKRVDQIGDRMASVEAVVEDLKLQLWGSNKRTEQSQFSNQRVLIVKNAGDQLPTVEAAKQLVGAGVISIVPMEYPSGAMHVTFDTPAAAVAATQAMAQHAKYKLGIYQGRFSRKENYILKQIKAVVSSSQHPSLRGVTFTWVAQRVVVNRDGQQGFYPLLKHLSSLDVFSSKPVHIEEAEIVAAINHAISKGGVPPKRSQASTTRPADTSTPAAAAPAAPAAAAAGGGGGSSSSSSSNMKRGHVPTGTTPYPAHKTNTRTA